MLSAEGPPNKKSKNNSDNTRKEKKAKSPTREHKKSETEVTVEVFLLSNIVNVSIILSVVMTGRWYGWNSCSFKPTHSGQDPPEPEELIKAIQDLESNAASSDEAVRQRIAQLPSDVSELGLLSKVEGECILFIYGTTALLRLCCIWHENVSVS